MSSENDSCVFCRIEAREVPAHIVHESDDVLAFADLNPQAPTHILVIPRRHVASMNDLEEADAELAGRVLLAAAEVARAVGMDETGYRVVVNTGDDGAQTVPHLHLHLLGGRRLLWPPG